MLISSSSLLIVNILGNRYCKWCSIPKSHYRIKWRQQDILNIYVVVCFSISQGKWI